MSSVDHVSDFTLDIITDVSSNQLGLDRVFNASLADRIRFFSRGRIVDVDRTFHRRRYKNRSAAGRDFAPLMLNAGYEI
jgi:hypothetical protein